MKTKILQLLKIEILSIINLISQLKEVHNFGVSCSYNKKISNHKMLKKIEYPRNERRSKPRLGTSSAILRISVLKINLFLVHSLKNKSIETYFHEFNTGIKRVIKSEQQ